MQLALPPTRHKWLGVPVDECSGTLGEIAKKIPQFTRKPFALSDSNGHPAKQNPFFDMIIREPLNGEADRVPVGVVSKSYSLLQHTEVLSRATVAMEESGIKPDEIRADLKLSQNGERMSLQLLFPERYSMMPGDGRPMLLRLLCNNSVDGSLNFAATLGWFRLVCSNGLVIGTVSARIKEVHSKHLDVTRIGNLLKRDLAEAMKDHTRFERWIKTPVHETMLCKWVDKDLREAWGVKAAARAYHIALHGCDAELTQPFEKLRPSQRTVKPSAKVPGADFADLNAFGVCQALSWLAKERHEFQEHIERDLQAHHCGGNLLLFVPRALFLWTVACQPVLAGI